MENMKLQHCRVKVFVAGLSVGLSVLTITILWCPALHPIAYEKARRQGIELFLTAACFVQLAASIGWLFLNSKENG